MGHNRVKQWTFAARNLDMDGSVMGSKTVGQRAQ